MIPDEGRDVQCSNCGKTWFQAHSSAIADVPMDQSVEDQAEYSADSDIANVAEEETIEPQDHSEYQADDSEDDWSDEDDHNPSAQPAFEPAAGDVSTRVDENILGILREEASREINARREDGTSGLETQPDLGLTPDASEEAVRARTSRLRGGDMETTAIADPDDPSSRSELLPDIDEINSTLTNEPDEDESYYDEDFVSDGTRHRRGFRFGFSLVLMFFAVMILLYLLAPLITARVPSLEPALASYVDWGNGVRLWIDGLMGRAIDGLSGFTGGDDTTS
jgi:hypothetical protein